MSSFLHSIGSNEIILDVIVRLESALVWLRLEYDSGWCHIHVLVLVLGLVLLKWLPIILR